MDEQHQRRVAENEVRFRDMNERRRAEGASFHGAERDDVRVMCECALSQCEDEFDVAIREYRRVRENDSWFIVRPGHEIPSAEFVAERHGQWQVVEKFGIGDDIANGDA